ncbi:MAG: cytochrome c oxidase subunit II transmembrane domain-containing protein, partial [Pseudomonadota bacterium]
MTRATGAIALSVAASAAAYAAQPLPWQMGFQPAATDIMSEIRWFEQYTLWFLTPIVLFVLGLLV